MNMGTEASPVEILDVAHDDHDDDDDDVSVLLYPPPSASMSVRRRRGTHRHNAIPVDHYYSPSPSDHNNTGRFALVTGSSSSNNRSGKERSVHNNNNKTAVIIDLSPEYPLDAEDVQVLYSSALRRNSRRTRTNPSSSSSSSSSSSVGVGVGVGISIREPGESSNSNPNPNPNHNRDDNDHHNSTTTTFMCEICVEPKPYTESFTINGCTHSYCTDCMIKYVASKLHDNITQIPCPVPDCKGLLEPDQCHSILPPEVFDRWGNALCEALILASQKFYCPFKDCSALLLIEEEEVITQSECPECRRLFCARCKVVWHSGIECGEFQKLNKDEREREDIMLMQLAKDNKWTRCPKCRFYVERSQGCLFMRCRCGYTFCYNCGVPMTSHYCSNCKH